jgi:hypothetical protein
LFEELGISKSGKRGVETMRSPLFVMVKSLSTIAVLSDGKVVEVMGVMTKTEQQVLDELWVVAFTDDL